MCKYPLVQTNPYRHINENSWFDTFYLLRDNKMYKIEMFLVFDYLWLTRLKIKIDFAVYGNLEILLMDACALEQDDFIVLSVI